MTRSGRTSRVYRAPPGGPFVCAPLAAPQDRSKIAPKTHQKSKQKKMTLWYRFGVVLGSLLDPLGRPNRAKIGPRGPKIPPRGLLAQIFNDFGLPPGGFGTQLEPNLTTFSAKMKQRAKVFSFLYCDHYFLVFYPLIRFWTHLGSILLLKTPPRRPKTPPRRPKTPTGYPQDAARTP